MQAVPYKERFTMTTAAKAKNGRVTADAVAEAAGKFTEDVKAAADTWLDATGKVAEETKAILDTQQQMMQDGFVTWQKHNQANLEFFAQASQQVFKESLTVYERWSKMNGGNWKKAQKLWLTEQDAATEATEAFWTQTQAASERMFKFFTATFQ
jgi:hypothetical protein